MAKTKRQAAVDSAVQSIISGGKRKAAAAGGSPKPLGVKLEAEEISQLDLIAAELGFSRHAVLQHAVRYFLAGWLKGDRPEISSKAVKILKVK